MGRHRVALAGGALLVSAAACLVDIPPLVSGDGGAADATFEQVQTAQCSGARACIPSSPSGWIGPVMLASGASGSNPTSCPNNAAEIIAGHTDLVAADATCASCGCTVTFKSCQATTCELDKDGLCQIPLQLSGIGTGCQQVSGTIAGAKISVPLTATGVCTSDGGAPTNVPTPTWSADVLACANGGFGQSDCPNGDVCADAPPAPFENRACVLQTGDVACPAIYTQKRVVYASFTDTRGCSSCACKIQTGSNCSGAATLQVFSDSACATETGSFAANGACVAAGGQLAIGSMRLAGATPPNNLGCTPSGGQPTGAVTGTSPTTVCCLP